MKVSIVTISFNQAPYLRACIESVLSQDHPDVEYIVVDPGSTDGSRAIIDEYRNEIDRVIYSSDDGPADGLNKGFRVATGEIFGYLNADDLLLEGSLGTVAHTFASRDACDILLGRGYQVDGQGQIVRTLYPSTTWTLQRYAVGAARAVQQATFFRATAFGATKGFNAGNRTCWDGELLVDMVLAGARVCPSTAVLGSFRLYPGSISGSGRQDDAYREEQHRIRQKCVAAGHGRPGPMTALMLRLTDAMAQPGRMVDRGVYFVGQVANALQGKR